MENIFVKNSGDITLQSFDDRPDGLLCIGEELKNIPFSIKRFYFITALDNEQAVRGKHAHRETEQCIFCLRGSFQLELDDGKNKENITMNDPSHGVLLGKLLWHTMSNFSQNCVILVVASDTYKKEDYIRDYSEFKNLTTNN